MLPHQHKILVTFCQQTAILLLTLPNVLINLLANRTPKLYVTLKNSMQNEYVDFAKKYITGHPEYLLNPDQLAFQLKTIGIPEKHIKGIVEELTGQSPESIVTLQSPGQKQNIRKRHIELFVILYFIVIAGMLLFIFFAPSVKRKKEITYVIPNPVIQSSAILPKAPTGGVIKQVYANELPVKMQQVFSYPVKDIKLGPSIRPKKEVVGFIPYWAIDSLDKLNVDELKTANLFGIEPDGEGNIIITNTQGQSDGGWSMWNDPRLPSFIDTLRKKQVVTNITIKMFSNLHMNSLLSSSDAQKKLISNILYMVGSKNLGGVNLDFEYVGNVPDSVRNGFTDFVTNLHTELISEFPRATLTIDTYASSGVSNDLFDLPTLAHVVDAFIIMGYDFHTPYTEPGPIAPLTGERSIVSYLANYLQRVPADKIILGVPYYGYDWVMDSLSPSSTAILSYADIVGGNPLGSVQWDLASETPWYQYLDGQSKTHKVYFDNVRSLGLKYDLVNDRNLKGIGIWAVGYEGSRNELDQLISQKFGY